MGAKPAAGATLAQLEQVYRSELGRFRRVARAIVQDEELARDVVQEAFAAAVVKRGEFRGDGPLEAWLWRTVVNRALAERRRSRTRGIPVLSVADEHRNGGGDDLSARTAAAVALLPERQRLAVFLRYYADLDYAAIARVLEISAGTVGATLTTARTTLLHALTEKEAER